MELNQQGLLEELVALRRDSWSTYPVGLNEFFPSGWNFDSFDENPVLASSNHPSLVGFSTTTEPTFESDPFNQTYPFIDAFAVPQFDSSSYNQNDTPPSLPIQEEDYPSMVEEEEIGLVTIDLHSLEEMKSGCKIELEEASTQILPGFNNNGVCGERKRSVKKLEGQPSKNLMAERRRRKRLNDRLSMLRSIVPKISKMDRTSILGDTIDYMKELLEKINKLQEDQEIQVGTPQINLMGKFKEIKPNEVLLVRNAPKFDVERRDSNTKIEICCATRPGLLLSTVNSLQALGLEIQHCVISCFNDFSMQASCSEVWEQGNNMGSEDIKQALFKNAGYGGRCL